MEKYISVRIFIVLLLYGQQYFVILYYGNSLFIHHINVNFYIIKVKHNKGAVALTKEIC